MIFYQEETISRAIFASLGKFIIFDNGSTKTHAANLTSFEGILSKHEAFLAVTSKYFLNSK